MYQRASAGGGGSDWYNVILLTTAPGAAITITDGDEEIEATGTGSQQAIAIHDESATYTISVVVNGFTKPGTNVSTGTTSGVIFEREVAFAEVTLTYDDDFRSQSGTISDGTTTANYTFPASDNETTIYIPSTGTWNVYCTVSGEQYKSSDIVVTSLSDSYTSDIHVRPNGKTVTPTDDIQTWLECGGIKGKFYTTLDEVLADHETLQKLISDENAVDYMVRSKTFINKGLVPVMTDATHPSGEATASSQQTGYEAYRAFNGVDDSSIFWSTSGAGQGSWLQYEFPSAVIVKSARIRSRLAGSQLTLKGYEIQASNDGFVNQTVVLYSGTAPNADTPQYVSFDNDTAYKYYRLYATTNSYYTSGTINIVSLQFYPFERGITEDETAMRYIGKRNYAADTLLADEDWCEGIVNSTYYNSVLNVSVPTMTDDTHPSGECFGSAGYNSNWHWYNAFAPNTAGFLGTNSATGQYIGYDFKKLVKLCAIKFKNGKMYNWSILTNYDIEHSDDITDPTSWSKIGIYATGSTAIGDVVSQSINMSGKAKAFRILNNGTGFGISDIEMLCREDVDESKIDIYTATNDTVYKEVSGSPVTLGTISDNGNVLRVARTDLPVGTHKLGSTVAKDPDDLTADYTKDVNIFDGMIEIMLMPENALYWYGYSAVEFDQGNYSYIGATTNAHYYQALTIAKNINDITLSGSGSAKFSGVYTKDKVKSGTHSTLNVVSHGYSPNASNNRFGTFVFINQLPSSSGGIDSYRDGLSNNFGDSSYMAKVKKTVDLQSTTDDYLFFNFVYDTACSISFDALWLS